MTMRLQTALLLYVLLQLVVPSLSAATPVVHEELERLIAILDQRIERTPRSATLYIQRAELQRLHHDWPCALRDLDRAHEWHGDAGAIVRLRARVWSDMGQPQAAIALLNERLGEQPREVRSLLLRGEFELASGAARAAAADYQLAIECSRAPAPDHYLAWSQAVRGADSDADKGRTGALACIAQGLERLGSLPVLELAALELEREAGAVEAALSRLRRLERATRRPERWLFERGEVLLSAGRRAAARSAYSDALRAISRLRPKLRGTRAMRALDERISARLAAL